jgi:hypothetical protein
MRDRLPPCVTGSLEIVGLVPEISDKHVKNESELSPPTLIQSKKICQDNVLNFQPFHLKHAISFSIDLSGIHLPSQP